MRIAVFNNDRILGYLFVNGNKIPSFPDMISLLHNKSVKGWTKYEEAAE